MGLRQLGSRWLPLALMVAVLSVEGGCTQWTLPNDRDELTRLMGSDDLAVRSAAAKKLAAVYGKDALLAALADANPKTRSEAALQLQGFTDADVQQALVAATRDSNPHVRYSAVVSLGRIGDQQVLEVIKELQDDREAFVADAATRALGNLQTRLGAKE